MDEDELKNDQRKSIATIDLEKCDNLGFWRRESTEEAKHGCSVIIMIFIKIV